MKKKKKTFLRKGLKEKDFKEIKERQLKYGEIKIRKEIKELFNKPINVSIDDMDNFEEKEMMKKGTLEKNTCYNWLFNYNPEPSISPPP